MTHMPHAILAAVLSGCLLVPTLSSAHGIAPRDEDGSQESPAAQQSDAESPRGRRSGRAGMPPAPDWPRAGGFGPAVQGADRPMIEGLVLEGMIPTSFGRRELTDADLARVLAVAREVSPDWGIAIEARIQADPAQMKAALRTSGRRLLGLAALKERAPQVYGVKVAELRAQAETERTAAGLHALETAPEANVDTVASGRKALEDAAARQVDATLAARRAELDALEERLERLRAEIDGDAARRVELAAEVVERAKKRAGDPRREGRRE